MNDGMELEPRWKVLIRFLGMLIILSPIQMPECKC